MLMLIRDFSLMLVGTGLYSCMKSVYEYLNKGDLKQSSFRGLFYKHHKLRKTLAIVLVSALWVFLALTYIIVTYRVILDIYS